MKRLLQITVLSIVAAAVFAPDAKAWDILFQGNTYLYRPTGTGARPVPGSPPTPLIVNYDDQTAPFGFSTVVGNSVNVYDTVSGSSLALSVSGPTLCCADGLNCNCEDGVNTVSWISDKWIWGSGVLGVTLIEQFNAATGAVAEADIQMNGQDFIWSLDDTPTANEVHLLSVMVHEMGHIASLGDLYDPRYANSTMFGYISRGSTASASLYQDDIDGIDFLYPQTAGDYPPPYITGFLKPADSVVQSRLIGGVGSQMLNFKIQGYGFIQTDGVNDISIAAQQGGFDVTDPALAFGSFTDFKEIAADITFSGSVGSYDLMVVNPNGKAGMYDGAFQVNLLGNVAPVATAAADFSSIVARVATVCATATDPAGDGDGDAALQYVFDLAVQPVGSTATLVATGNCVTFTPDILGKYLIDVYANDGLISGVIDSTLVKAVPKPAKKSGGGGGGGGGGGCSVNPSSDPEFSDCLGTIILLLFFAIPFVSMRKKYAANR